VDKSIVEPLNEVIQYGTNEINRLEEKVNQIQKTVLPTITKELISKMLTKSRMSASSGPMSIFSDSSRKFDEIIQEFKHDICRKKYLSINESIQKLESSLFVLEMLIKAKFESMNLVKQKLKSETTELQTKYNLLINEKNRAVNKIQEAEQELEKEKQHLKDQMQKLTLLHEKQRKHLLEENKKIIAEKKQVEKELNTLQIKFDELTEKKKKAEKEKEDVEKMLQSQDSVRLELVSELTEQKKLYQAAKEELSLLKLSQKFFRPNAITYTDNIDKNEVNSVALLNGVSKERFNLMKMVNQLMEENNNLKQEQAALNLELKHLKTFSRTCINTSDRAHKMDESCKPKSNEDTTTHQEVALVADDRLSLDTLTNKVLSDMFLKEM
jgi:hypothetical protein